MKLSLKQAVAVFLCLANVFCLSACGGKKQDVSAPKSKSEQVSVKETAKKESAITEITDADLAPFKELATDRKLKKEELIDVLSTLTKLFNFQRLRPYVNPGYATNSSHWLITSLPNEIRDSTRIFLNIEKDEKSGRNILKSVEFGNFESDREYLYYPSAGLTKATFNVDDMFVTEEKYKKMRNYIESKYVDVKELKNVAASKIRFEEDIYYIIWAKKGAGRNYSIKPMLAYGTIVSYDEEYYGGKETHYVQTCCLFDSENITPVSPIKAFGLHKSGSTNSTPSSSIVTFDYEGKQYDANFMSYDFNKQFNEDKNIISKDNQITNFDNAIVFVNESSALRENNQIYSATQAIDGDLKTCWAEGVSGLGIGEHITFGFRGEKIVHGLTIWTGYQKSEDLFNKNSRPIAIKVLGAGDSVETYTLKDSMGPQKVEFKKPVKGNHIKIYIEKVSPGSKYEDTCISEISFF